MIHKFQKIVLTTDKTELNPLLNPKEKAHLQVYGITSTGEKIPIDSNLIRWNVQTLYTSGETEVLSVEKNGTVLPKNGGYALIEASYVGVGHGLSDSMKIVVRPFFHEYHKTLTFKLFMGMDPYGSLRQPVSYERDEHVLLTFEETLDIIRRLDRITCGIPKIVYLVGWQRGGHDHGYPAFNEVNPKLKRAEDTTAAESLRWLIRESKQYNTDVSIHINLVDAWDDSPLWNEYHANHILVEKEDGSVQCAGGGGFEELEEQFGIRTGNVCQKRLWETGFFHKRVAELLELLPELADTHTLHIDNWRAVGFPTRGISRKDDEETIQKMYRYFRDLGLDVTSEGSFHGREEPMTGLQPMTWWDIPYHPSVMPPSLYCGGRDKRVDGDPRFGDSIHIENTVQSNQRRGRDPLQGIQDEFCMYTLPWRFLNEFSLKKFDGNEAVYEGGVRASIEEGIPVIFWNDMQIRRGTTLTVPAVWKEEKEILMYSYRDTYCRINLPTDWADVTSVDLYYMDPLGKEEPRLEVTAYPIKNGVFAFLLDTRTMFSIRPHVETAKI